MAPTAPSSWPEFASCSKSRQTWRSKRSVLVVAAEPELRLALFVASQGSAVQEAVVGHRRLEAARRRHIGPVDDPVGECVGAQSRPFSDVSAGVGAAGGRQMADGGRDLALQERLQLFLGVHEA